MSEDFLYFKYKPITKFLVESLVNSNIYLAKPSQLNDPFDCQISLRKSIELAAQTNPNRKLAFQAGLSAGNLLENWQNQFEDIGVCAFSLTGPLDDNAALLWSHYADDHKGVCLLYRFTEDFLNDQKNQILGVDKIKYGSNILTDWLANGPSDPSSDEFVIELTKIYLTAKGPAWHYENEARIIRFKHGAWNIPTHCLEQICFGLRTPVSDINLVSELARKYSKCSNFFQMARADNDFGLVANPL